MKKYIAIITCLSIFLLFAAAAQGSETYFRFKIDSPKDISRLTKIISIDDVRDNVVYAYANNQELENFKQLGIEFEILQHPGTLIQPEMSSDKADIAEWDSYPTYEGYVSMMNQFAADYPSLCQIVNAGSSVQGRSILFAKISDNVGTEENEPEVMFSSSIHGDETTGFVLMLRLIDSLLSAYGSDSLITRLVDSCEIWINPAANPDGTYHGGNSSVYGATRYNVNGVDLNRNFPDPQDGDHPDGNSWQPETIVMMNLASAHSFAISANFHGGVEVVNYPWDTWSRLHPDNQWFIDISRMYADSAQYYSPSGYMTYLNDGITNGYAWYEVNGGRQDFMNFWYGCREATIEISDVKLLSASQLPAHWVYNRVSFLNWFENALYGVRGIVTDSVTGLPIAATITVVGHDTGIDSSRIFTDPDVGDYHRMLDAGTYTLEFKSPGYTAKTVSNITITDNHATVVDVALAPLTADPVLVLYSHTAGEAGPGDTVDFYIQLKNNGGGNAYNVSGVLGIDDSYITVSQPNSTYPNISAEGGTATSNSAYQFIISEDSPDLRSVQFYVDVAADGGYSDRLYFDYFVGKRSVAFYDDFSFDQGWTGLGGLGEWTIGPAVGGTGGSGAGDPSLDHTATSDNYVLGNDLTLADGSYNASLTTTYWVTSPYIDCTNLTGMQIRFFRWLGIESSTYDHAYLQAYNGSSWVTVHQNSGTVDESSWNEQLYDLSAIADGNPDFQIRFGIGTTDGSGQYCGWNIDDITIEGYGEVACGTPSLAISPTELADTLHLGDSAVDTLKIYNNGDALLRIRFSTTDTWLSFNGDQQNINVADSLLFPVTINSTGLPTGDNMGSIAFTSNDLNNLSGNITVNLHIYSPDIQLPQTSITETLPGGAQTSQEFIINNNGPGRLDYEISRLMFSGKSAELSTEKVTTAEPVGYISNDPDRPEDIAPQFNNADKGSGGPDNWGHIWVDSDDPSGPVFEWVDISSVGTEIIGFGDDDSSAALPLGFEFPFFQDSYSTLHVGSNGIVTFGGGSTVRTNTILPYNAAPNNMIAMWWDDLDPRRGGNIYYFSDTENERFIVSFVGIKNYYSTTGTGSLTFQVILYPNGRIILQYGVMDPGADASGLAGATVGIEDASGADGLSVVFDNTYMHDNLSVQILAANWLSVSPSSGTIDPYSADTVTIGFDAADLAEDTYTGQLTINSNDPDTPVIDVPVLMTVSGQSEPPAAPVLTSPDSGAIDIILPVMLDWDDAATADLYQLQIDTAALYLSPVYDTTVTVSECSMSLLDGGMIFYWHVRAHNDAGWGEWSQSRDFATKLSFICGDVNASGSVNILDVTALISYLYKGGTAPDPAESGDVNDSGSLNILDVTYLINYLYKEGPAPSCP
ncbi:MAG: M14 family zinc carboxypeptidase [Candidatus Zixiibacteriota bacterium]